jgi:hypothetical protein
MCPDVRGSVHGRRPPRCQDDGKMSGRGLSPQMSLVCATPAMCGLDAWPAFDHAHDRHGRCLTGERLANGAASCRLSCFRPARFVCVSAAGRIPLQHHWCLGDTRLSHLPPSP